MVTPIRPSLAQMLQTPSAVPKQAPAQASGFNAALAAQKAFFQQVGTQAAATPKITPATYTAADIARASTQAQEPDTDTPPKRPGSFLNIVV